MNREDRSEVLDRILNPPVRKTSSCFFDRVSLEIKKVDPFEEKASADVWTIKGNKLLKNKKYEDK
jgi:hypothetical protein